MKRIAIETKKRITMMTRFRKWFYFFVLIVILIGRCVVVHQTKYLRNLQIAADISDSDAPQLAWLMTFPQSGSYFLQRAIHMQTETSTGINFGEAFMDTSGVILSKLRTSIPIYSGSKSKGPFFFSDTYSLQKNSYVLTRTYCAGFCTLCMCKNYNQNSNDYLYECSLTSHYDGQKMITGETYDVSLVKKVVHLTRNPLTLVVARFELEVQGWRENNRIPMTEYYPSGKEGFRKYCFDHDNSHQGGLKKDENRSWNLTNEGRELAAKIPCHADFYRIIHWQNNFFEVMSNQLNGVPVKHIFYEDLSSRPQEVMDSLIDYLGLFQKNKKLPPLKDFAKDITGYFTGTEINDIKKFIDIFASKETSNHLQIYSFMKLKNT